MSLTTGYNANKEAAESTKQQLEQDYHIKVVIVGGDIAAEATMQKLFKAVQELFDNECTAFVHNVGLSLGITTGSSEMQPASDAGFEQT